MHTMTLFSLSKKLTKTTLFFLSGIIGILFYSPSLITISLLLLLLVGLEKQLRIFIPTFISIIFMAFSTWSLILGSEFGFYEKYYWWDDLLHFSYGIGFSFIGYLIIQFFSIRRHVSNDIFLIMIFSFCFTLACGVLWEIYEFFLDSFFAMDTQSTHFGTGVTDTMQDLIVATIAAFLTDLVIYLYLRFGDRHWLSKFARKFREKSRFFHKKV